MLGVYTIRLWRGTLDKHNEFISAESIAIGYAIVIGVCALAAVSSGWEDEFGPWAKYQGIYAGITFTIGLAIGWIEGRHEAK
jgi:hypothetical protein